MCLWTRMLALEWKERAFIEKVNSRCFCWFPAAILVHQNGAPIWRLHTKLYKGAWNVSATNSETVGHKDLRFGKIVYILVFYNISLSWLLPLDGFQFFLCRFYCVTVKTKNIRQNQGLCLYVIGRQRVTCAEIAWLTWPASHHSHECLAFFVRWLQVQRLLDNSKVVNGPHDIWFFSL